jgi:hypothetical protein
MPLQFVHLTYITLLVCARDHRTPSGYTTVQYNQSMSKQDRDQIIEQANEIKALQYDITQYAAIVAERDVTITAWNDAFVKAQDKILEQANLIVVFDCLIEAIHALTASVPEPPPIKA